VFTPTILLKHLEMGINYRKFIQFPKINLRVLEHLPQNNAIIAIDNLVLLLITSSNHPKLIT